MIDIRQFIRDLGKDAPAYFDTTDKTVQRWIKTGNVPIKIAQKIYAADEAIKKQAPPQTSQEQPQVVDDGLDPLTHLPRNIDRTYQGQPPMGGKLPETIEISPTEQSFGNNMTRPGRISAQPMPPMKLREEGGQKIAYVDNTPKTPTVLPPTMANAGWADQGAPLPAPKKALNPNESRTAQRTPENVPAK
jgi:hypothetical protein